MEQFPKLLDAYEKGNTELKRLITKEANVILECSFCLGFFRKLGDFVVHKKRYCPSRCQALQEEIDAVQATAKEQQVKHQVRQEPNAAEEVGQSREALITTRRPRRSAHNNLVKPLPPTAPSPGQSQRRLSLDELRQYAVVAIQHFERDAKIFHCPVCYSKVSARWSTECFRHLLSAHSICQPYKCPLDKCDYTTFQQNSVESHVKTAHKMQWTEGMKKASQHVENQKRLDDFMNSVRNDTKVEKIPDPMPASEMTGVEKTTEVPQAAETGPSLVAEPESSLEYETVDFTIVLGDTVDKRLTRSAARKSASNLELDSTQASLKADDESESQQELAADAEVVDSKPSVTDKRRSSRVLKTDGPSKSSSSSKRCQAEKQMDFDQLRQYVPVVAELFDKKAKMFHCPVCFSNFSARYLTECYRHLVKVHSIYHPFKCPTDECDFTTIKRTAVESHVTAVHKVKWTEAMNKACVHEENYKQIEAFMEYTRQGVPNANVKKEQLANEVVSPDAAAPASSLEYVNAEDTQSATQKSTTDHAEGPAESSQTQSSSCDQPSQQRFQLEQLRRHVVNIINDMKAGLYQCPICKDDVPASTRSKCIQHLLRVHGSTLPYACPHDSCDSSFLWPSEMEDHAKRVHKMQWTPDWKSSCFDRAIQKRLDELLKLGKRKDADVELSMDLD